MALPLKLAQSLGVQMSPCHCANAVALRNSISLCCVGCDPVHLRKNRTEPFLRATVGGDGCGVRHES